MNPILGRRPCQSRMLSAFPERIGQDKGIILGCAIWLAVLKQCGQNADLHDCINANFRSEQNIREEPCRTQRKSVSNAPEKFMYARDNDSDQISEAAGHVWSLDTSALGPFPKA